MIDAENDVSIFLLEKRNNIAKRCVIDVLRDCALAQLLNHSR